MSARIAHALLGADKEVANHAKSGQEPSCENEQPNRSAENMGMIRTVMRLNKRQPEHVAVAPEHRDTSTANKT